MKKFEVGHVYYDQYACDSETISTIKIIKRTAKTVTFERGSETRRAKLYEDANGEYIMPDHYSMACVYRAERELLDEEPEQAADNAIRFPQGYDIAEAVVKYTTTEMLKAIFGTGDLNAKQLDFLAALTDKANRAVK